MASATEQDRVRELQRALYRAAKADPHGGSRMPAVKNVGEPCAGEPHARFEVAAGGNLRQSALPRGAGASRRPYICIGSRRIEYVACTSNPDGAWMLQQARNLLIDLDDRDQRPRLLVHDRDAKFSRAFDAVFHGDGIRVIRTPVQAPNANTHIERWVGSARRECLDRMLIFSRRQLERALSIYVRHYNERRPHRALDLQTPDSSRLASTHGQPRPRRFDDAICSADSSTNTKRPPREIE